jgi:hypothetical protein
MLGPAPDAPLQLTVQLADGFARDHRAPLGTFTVTNTSDRPVSGSTGPAAWVWICRGGTVVTEPGAMPAVAVQVELPPGESVAWDLHSVLRQCDTAPTDPMHPPGMPSRSDAPLSPGRYEVYISWDLRTHDGAEIVLYAGPVGIDVR